MSLFVLVVINFIIDIKQRQQGATNIVEYLKSGGEVEV